MAAAAPASARSASRRISRLSCPVTSIEGSGHAVSAAPFGSASILPITWMYIRMMGASGLKQATEMAILNANYIVAQARSALSRCCIKGRNGRVAHECILDTRVLKESAGISVEDIAKRLIDYGFHAPTMSWPVAGTLMVEPTEVRAEARDRPFLRGDDRDRQRSGEGREGRMAEGRQSAGQRTAHGDRSAGRRVDASLLAPRSGLSGAAIPTPAAKYWPPVSRIDNVAGDRNLVCACPPLSEYLGAAE